MRDITLLHRIRRARGFSRGVTILIVLALIGLTAERTIYYLLNKADVIEAQTPAEQLEQLQQRAPQLAKQLGLPAPVSTSSQNASDTENTGNTHENPAEPTPAAQLSTTLVDLQRLLGTLNTQLDQGQSTEARLNRLQAQLLTLNAATLDDFAFFLLFPAFLRLPQKSRTVSL